MYSIKGDGKGGQIRTDDNLQKYDKAQTYKDTWGYTNTIKG